MIVAPPEEITIYRGVKPLDFPARVSLGCRLTAARKRRDKEIPPTPPPPVEDDGHGEG